MTVPTFNLAAGEKAARNKFVVAVKVGTNGYEILGDGVTESMNNFNIESEDYADILGNAGVTIKGMKPSQEFTPLTLKGGSKLAEVLHDIMRRQALTELQQFEVLQIYAYMGEDGAWEADKQVGCTIMPTSLGGGSTVDMPITIYYSNTVTAGTVNKYLKQDEAQLAFTAKTGA